MDLEQQLHSALVPCRPGPHLRAGVMARVSAVRSARRGPGRVLLSGIVVVVAAAAAMLAMRTSQSQHSASASLAPVPATPQEVTAIPPEAAIPATVGDKEDQGKVEPVAATARSFTVRVLPLGNDDTDPVRKDSVATLYAAFLDKLRAVPGLILLTPVPAANASEPPPNYRITIGAQPQTLLGKSWVRLQIDTLKHDGGLLSSFITSYAVDATSPCTYAPHTTAAAWAVPACADPENVAASLVASIRRMVFPPDPSLQRMLLAGVLDRSLAAEQRLQALTLLASFGRAHMEEGVPRTSAPDALRDPAVIRAVVDFATGATDPKVRAQAWAALRGTGDSTLVTPLVTVLDRDSDGEVRLAALDILVGDFAEDPRVHAALQSAAQRDARPMIRALAQRSLGGTSGDAAWKNYLLGSLKDANRPVIERIEPLFYQLGLPTVTVNTSMTPLAGQNGLQMLDAEAIRALTEALPKAATESSLVRQSTAMLMNQLAGIDDPAITDMLLASLDDDSHWLQRADAIEALRALPSRRADPRVRAVLDAANADDSNSHSQRTADTSAAPDGMAATAGGPKPPRLGVVIAEVEPAPYVPTELIGKTRIARVAPGSVGQSAGLMEGDILLEINGTPISSPADAPRVLDSLPKGVDVEVVVQRFGEAVRLMARF